MVLDRWVLKRRKGETRLRSKEELGSVIVRFKPLPCPKMVRQMHLWVGIYPYLHSNLASTLYVHD
jgi:hypothetical protein